MCRYECNHPEAYITENYYKVYGIYCCACKSYWVIKDKSELPLELQVVSGKTFAEIMLKELHSPTKAQTVEEIQIKYPEVFVNKNN